jgi:putative ABC transport system permease protein
MNFVALRMLTGDRAKYFGLIFAIAFCTFLLENQASIFANIMRRTASQILDVTDAEVWVMDPQTEYWEQTKALKDTDLTRVRGVPGVEWAVRLFKGTPVARTPSGKFAAAFLIGLDDASLAGAPRRMFMGSWTRLRDPYSVVIDRAGYILLFPGQPFELGRTVEMNDHKVTIVGISEAAAPFVSLPIMHARYSEAVTFLGRERTQLSFVIARPVEGVSPEALTERIAAHTGLRARTANEFMWDCIRYYMRNTGIPINFGITIGVALLVGTVVAGQTFYLFTLENLKQFGALKAIGVTNLRLIGMADGESPLVQEIRICSKPALTRAGKSTSLAAYVAIKKPRSPRYRRPRKHGVMCSSVRGRTHRRTSSPLLPPFPCHLRHCRRRCRQSSYRADRTCGRQSGNSLRRPRALAWRGRTCFHGPPFLGTSAT